MSDSSDARPKLSDLDFEFAFDLLVADTTSQVQVDCEFWVPCPVHVRHDCPRSAQWLATLHCLECDDPCVIQVVCCAGCRQQTMAAGDRTATARVVQWLPLHPERRTNGEEDPSSSR